MPEPATQPRDVEATARAALEARAGRRLDDKEWETFKHDLLQLFRLLEPQGTPIAPNTPGSVLSLAKPPRSR